jgi:hypothetical protein
MAKVFISHRREGSFQAALIRDKLAAHFSHRKRPLEVVINADASACDLVIVVIESAWVAACNDPEDPIRNEIENALVRGSPIIPVVVESAEMPTAAHLPERMKQLANRTPIRLRPLPEMDRDLVRLVRAVESALGIHVDSAIQTPRSSHVDGVTDRPPRETRDDDELDSDEVPTIRKRGMHWDRGTWIAVAAGAIVLTLIGCCGCGCLHNIFMNVAVVNRPANPENDEVKKAMQKALKEIENVDKGKK